MKWNIWISTGRSVCHKITTTIIIVITIVIIIVIVVILTCMLTMASSPQGYQYILDKSKNIKACYKLYDKIEVNQMTYSNKSYVKSSCIRSTIVETHKNLI